MLGREESSRSTGSIRVAPSRALAALAALGLAVVAALGALSIARPFSGDQALFLLGAQSLAHGGVLYRDFWDLKQPGIFLFYLAGGLGFGFTQSGAHAADLCWQVAFGAALVAGLARSLRDARFAAVAPLLVPGAYFAASSPWHLMQVEALVGPLFFLEAVAAIGLARRPASSVLPLASGLAAGIAVSFKLLFAGIALAIFATIAVLARRELGRVGVVRACGLWTLGLCAPLAAFAAYAGLHGAGAIAFETSLTLPLAIARTMPHAPAGRLIDCAVRFALYFRGAILLAAIGAALERAPRSRTWRAVSYAWLLAAIATVYVQRQSWWQYQALLALPPIGILATYGVAALAHRVRTSGARSIAWLAACAAVSYVAVPIPQGAIALATSVLRSGAFASKASLERYRRASSAEYAAAAADASALTAERAPGGVFVLGDPLIYLAAGERPILATSGWAPHLYTEAVWRRLDAELRAARPRSVFEDDVFSANLATWSPETQRYLRAAYVPVRRTRDGVWSRAR